MTTGSLSDVKHVVILMQENRSFDHYFGTMRGVRGFGDRSAVVQPNGKSVFYQPDSGRVDGGYLLPFHVDTATVDGQDLGDLSHSWSDQHAAVAGGKNNGWVAAKGEMTMSYFTETDISFHRALADAFTICDHYFCSIQGPTTPNRLYHWTGAIDAEGVAGGPATSNPADYKAVYQWGTYPEQLSASRVSWQVYANDQVGDNGAYPYLGDYGDNPLWLFNAYHDPKNTELISRGSITPWKTATSDNTVEHVLSRFIADCRSSSLPAVSWVVAPYGYCEHPAARPVNGAAYVQGVLNALWGNPELWKSTAVLLNFDENDGFFDHVPPPMPPDTTPRTPGEFVNNVPIGLGARVPMTVISPWSRGGWVNSQVFDHTSVIRFLEVWTGVKNTNISAWRRSICGDLTSCFDFSKSDTSIPVLPDTTALRAAADASQSRLPRPTTPALGKQAFPVQEPGSRPARALPYGPVVNGVLDSTGKLVTTFGNTGSADVQLAAYRADSRTDGPWRYDVHAGASVADTWNVPSYGDKKYAIAVHGPNRFLWSLAGSSTSPIEVTASYTVDRKLRLAIANHGSKPAVVTIKANHYRTDGPWTYGVAPAGSATADWDALGNGQGWYDLALTVDIDPGFLRGFIGHVENGEDSVTG